jgi:hypothetical protein
MPLFSARSSDDRPGHYSIRPLAATSCAGTTVLSVTWSANVGPASTKSTAKCATNPERERRAISRLVSHLSKDGWPEAKGCPVARALGWWLLLLLKSHAIAAGSPSRQLQMEPVSGFTASSQVESLTQVNAFIQSTALSGIAVAL